MTLYIVRVMMFSFQIILKKFSKGSRECTKKHHSLYGRSWNVTLIAFNPKPFYVLWVNLNLFKS